MRRVEIGIIREIAWRSRKPDRDYVKSDLDLAEDDSDQGERDHCSRSDAYKHTNHKNGLFHP